MLFLYFFQQEHTHIMNYLNYFLPLDTLFKTHHLLDLHKEPVPDLCQEQLLPRKVILTFSPKVVRDLKILSKRRILKVKICFYVSSSNKGRPTTTEIETYRYNLEPTPEGCIPNPGLRGLEKYPF